MEVIGCDVEGAGVETELDLPELTPLLVSLDLPGAPGLFELFCTWGVFPSVTGPLLLRL